MFINRLPPEILGDIFLEAAISRFACEARKNYITRSSHNWEPLNIVHVCRYWREVALSMQMLWTSFEADNFKPETLAYWSSFARSSPLNLAYWLADEIKRGKPVDSRTVKKTEKMLHQFSLCAERWGSLYFRLEHPELAESLEKMLQTAAPRSTLRSFEILIVHETTPKAIDALALAISSLLTLRRFSLTCFSLEVQLSLPRVIPWHALEDVYICSSITVEDFIWCLMQCTSARNVTFIATVRERSSRFTNVSHNVQCTRPKLKSLTIGEYCDPYRFLQHFHLPSLVSLVIKTAHGPSNRLQDFLVRSQPPLQIFKLEVNYMTQNDVIGCISTPYLRSVPNVLARFPIIDLGPYLAEIIQRRPDILKELPKLKAWRDKTGSHIGWKTDK